MSSLATPVPTLPYPPGPKGHPILGTVREFQQDSLGTIVRLHQEYGDAVRLRFFLHFYGYVFFHPDHLKHILQDNNRNYTKMPSPTFQVMQPLIGYGLLTSDGDLWRRQRRLAQPAFHRRHITSFGQTMTTATQQMLDRWHTAAQQGQPLDVSAEITKLTLEIAGKTLFSMDLTGQASTVGAAFTDVNHIITYLTTQPFSPFTVRIPFWPTTRRMNAGIRQLDHVVNQIIAERRAAGEDKGDLLSMLMLARDEDTGEGMDDKQLRDEVMTLLLAGHETTAVALSWALYLLARHPDIARRLEAEVDAVLAGGRPVAMDDLPQLPYTRMVIDETLRLYPPAYAIARWAQQEDEVGGYRVAAQSAVTLFPYVTHRHPEFWPDPDRFDPQRFTPERTADRPRYAYVPFGGGPRQCIGNTFALTEAHLILASLVQRYRWQLVADKPVEMEPLITLRPKNGLPMRLSARG